MQPSFTCNDDGAFTVTLTVNDGHGHIVADNAAVTVANVKPTATAGGPYTGQTRTRPSSSAAPATTRPPTTTIPS